MNFFSFSKTGIQETNSEHYDWISFVSPDDKEKQYLTTELKLPEDFFNDIVDVFERPRIEYEDGWFFVLLRAPYKDIENENAPFYTVPIGIIFNEKKVYTITFYQIDVIDDFVEYTNRKKIHILNTYEFLVRFFISVSVWFSKYLKHINLIISRVEKSLQKKVKNQSIHSLFIIEKAIIYFNSTLYDHSFLFKRINLYSAIKNNVDPELIEDAEIELQQAQTTSRIYRDVLKRLEEAYDSIISNSLNKIMKRLTSISLILMLPTLISSFYGMNVPNGWEHYPNAFLILFFISISISIGVYIYFKKKGWF